MEQKGSHESLNRSFRKAAGSSSDRSFGFVFTAVFAIVALWPLRHVFAVESIRLPWLAASAAVLVAALAAPAVLAPFNRVWTRIGLLLHRIVNPVIMTLLFHGVFTPIGFLMRLSGKDPLRTKREPGATTYWVPRTTPPGSLKNQF